MLPSVAVEVRVELKPGILDAEADSVVKSLGLLGIGPIASVRTAKVFTLEFSGITTEAAEAKAREAVDRLLANPVIHHVSIAVQTS
jgi:phosphoribosylformylglycinamidine synthase PurS subunit